MPNFNRYVPLLPLLVLVALATIEFWPALYHGASLAHGDALVFSLPLHDLLVKFLHGEGSLLWTTMWSGGHPAFAEGQGGFAHPLNQLIAAFMGSLYGYNFLHWVYTIAGGAGMYGVCRHLGLSRNASLFAALSVAFSPLWLKEHRNGTLSSAIACIPWTIWAMQCWLRRPNVASSCCLGLAMCIMVLAGYPPIVHGTLLYFVVFLATTFLFPKDRQRWKSALYCYACTGIFAVVLCLGLSAVQWIPLLELASESSRSKGVGILEYNRLPPEFYFRGALFTTPPFESFKAFPFIGSLLVVVFASNVIFFRSNSKLVGHLLAALFLFSLALSVHSPVFNFVYENNLIPGLHSFRVFYIYLYFVQIGIAVLAAFALDQLGKTSREDLSLILSTPTSRVVARASLVAAWMAAWIIAIRAYHIDQVNVVQYGFVFLGLTVMLWSYWRGRAKLIPFLAVVLLIVEIVTLRLDYLIFAEKQAFATPASIEFIDGAVADSGLKTYAAVPPLLYFFSVPEGEDVQQHLNRFVRVHLWALMGNTSALRDTPSALYAGGLALERSDLANEAIEAEVKGDASNAPGLRLIDYLSLRYITATSVNPETGFRRVLYDEPLNISLFENPEAKPRFQSYRDAVFVNGPEKAISTLAEQTTKKLVVELPDSAPRPVSSGDRLGVLAGIKVLKDTPTDYQFELEAPLDTWFFMADANYPGWEAFVDGKEVNVFSAQVLGKAVFIPSGSRTLQISFNPLSFKIGLSLSIASLCVLALIVLIASGAKIRCNKTLFKRSTP